MDTVKIECSRPYEVLVGAGLLDTAGEHIARTTGCQTAAVVADDTVDALYGDRVQVSLERAGCRVVRFRFPHGEQSKTIATYVQLLHFLAENRLTRSDAVVALGGGVTGDLAGFAAATFMRGMALVQLPTTLLAAVDSSVGGKTAVDLPQGKNLAGAFHQPSLVLCDCDTLDTLPADVFRDGCAEVIKYGVLCDAQFFESLQKPVNEQREAVISRCVRIKSDIVSRDERDKGERQLLNLGHTIGHAIEQCSGFTVSHGQAVAIGMAHVARAAFRRGLCKRDCPGRIEEMLHLYGLPVSTSLEPEMLAQAALSDKKRTGKQITLVIPEEIGRCVLYPLPVSEIAELIREGVEAL